MAVLRKPVGVWVLLPSGQPWMFGRERTLGEAIRTARTLRGNVPSLAPGTPLFPAWRVWIAPPPQVELKRSLAPFRRTQRAEARA